MVNYTRIFVHVLSRVNNKNSVEHVVLTAQKAIALNKICTMEIAEEIEITTTCVSMKRERKGQNHLQT